MHCTIAKSFAKTTLLCSIIVILQEEIARWCDEAKEGIVYMYITCAREAYHCPHYSYTETSTEICTLPTVWTYT